jgi:hypothetical protein
VTPEPLPPNSNKSENNSTPESGVQSNPADQQILPTSTQAQANKPPHSCEITCNTNRDWVTIVLEGLGLTVLIVYTIATIKYAYITHDMWIEMQKQTGVQRDTSINQERAWVGLDVPITLDAIDISPKGGEILGHYTIKNFGQGPALKVVQFGNFVDLDMAVDAQKREADSYCKGAVDFTNGTVPVGGEMKQPPPFGYTLFPGQQHTELIQFGGKIGESTAKFLRFIGCVAYIDQFKHTHWTRFCMERKPGSPPTPAGKIPKLDFCAMYNDTDEPQE